MKTELGIPISQEVRGIPSIVVENVIQNGTKRVTTDKLGKEAMEHSLGNLKVFTDKNDFSVVISMRKETAKKGAK
jgi:hypothetical protein